MACEERRQECENSFNKALSNFGEAIDLTKICYHQQNENPATSKNMTSIASLLHRLVNQRIILKNQKRYKKICPKYNQT
jgi:hypothetical protein